jgi:hypothetical protein
MVEMHTYFFFRKSWGKRQLGKPRHRLEDNTEMGLKQIGWEGVDWIHLAHDRDYWRSCEHGNKHSDFVKIGEFLD